MGGYFFDEPQTKADFVYWSKIPQWTLDQIVALSLGKDPRFVSLDKFTHGTRGNDFAAAYFGRLDIVHAHRAAGELEEKTSSTRVIEWAEEYDFPLPQELVDLVRQLRDRRMKKNEVTDAEPAALEHSESTTSPAASTIVAVEGISEQSDAAEPAGNSELAIRKGRKKNADRLLLTRERETLQALLTAMAIAKYQYNPDDAKSKTPQLLVKLLERHGLTTGAQTVRNHLKDGAKLLPKRRPEK